MVVHNPNNWHWVDKNCISWAREYFNEKLPGLNTGKENSRKYAEIKSISSMEGDCEVNQRKGKVISLFDLKLVLLIGGNVADEKFDGSIMIPEIAFDSDIDDYQFEISIYKETATLHEIKDTIRDVMIPQLRKIFFQFGKDLLISQGSDIQVSENEVTSQYTKSNQQNSFSGVKENSPIAKTTASSVKTTATSTTSISVAGDKNGTSSKIAPKISTTGGNRSTIHLEPSFTVPAIELFNTFIDKERIMAWTRSGIKEDSQNQSNGSQYLMIGDKFELFNGNIENELIESKLGKKLVLKWRLNDWRQNVYSTLDMEFHESQEFHETKLQITWSGTPVGEEDRVRGNFEEYYVRPIKLIFGFGVVL